MTTSLDAYRSDREQLLARVRELEAEVDQLKPKSDGKPFDWLRRCPACGCEESSWNENQKNHKTQWITARYPKTCVERHGFWSRLLLLSGHAHVHQRCTACGARWVVDAEGWRFD